MEFGVLGPLWVAVDDRELQLRRQKLRALLAYLVLNAGEVVSVDRLLDELWGERPPATARNSLRNCVWQLRKLLGAEVLRTRPSGYMLDVRPDAIDLRRFVALLADAREQAAPARVATLQQALKLWRGPALADLQFEPFAILEAARLEELRAAAEEELVAAELELGRHAELVPRIEELVARNPLRERRYAQLMLALYRSGRQADALAAFLTARRTLVEELGIEPGPMLRGLEQAILRQDPALTEYEAAVASPRPADLRERRATVTVLFAEVTAQDDADAERYRALTARAFHELRAATEYHGGTIERLAGDELIAVFGVPERHEDDAVRAVRAALQIQRATRTTPELRVRIALVTGEVIAPGPAVRTPVAGAPVVLAKRLAEAAPPGEVVASTPTVELVHEAVFVEPLAPVRVRARATPIDAARVAGAREETRRQPVSRTPLVGRDEELRNLRAAFAEVVANDRSQVVTVFGDAGVGKTRLAIELAKALAADARVVVGRCVSYGEGATWLPLRDVAHQIDVAAALDGETASVLERLFGGGTVSLADACWAARGLLGAVARERPALIVLEDLHWAAPSFLAFVDQLEASPVEAPALVLALARSELAGELRRPATFALQPLSEQQVRALVDAAADETLPSHAREQIVELAEGNPLFAEQLLAYAAEHGIETLGAVPPTIEALLASRLDRLDAEERATLQRAAVVGREFWQAAVLHLTPSLEAPAVGRHLRELAQRDVIHTARSSSEREDAFRFHHVLIRDVAYASIPKLERAELHEAVAQWLDTQRDPDDEIVGYHLEHAYVQRAEIGAIDDHARRLAVRAGERLAASGIRAFKRGDAAAAVNLLGRATSLLPERDARRAELLCELGLAQRVGGEIDAAQATLSTAAEIASAQQATRVALRARVELAGIGVFARTEGRTAELLDVAATAIPALEAFGDDRALGRAWLLVGYVHGGFHCRNTEWREAAERALEHYLRAGWPSSSCLGEVAAALFYGPIPVAEATKQCKLLIDRAAGDRGSAASVTSLLAGLEAMRNRVGLARRLLASTRDVYPSLGWAVRFANTWAFVAAQVELLAGDAGAAEGILRASCATLEAAGEEAFLSSRAAELAETLYLQNRDDEASQWADVAERHCASDDYAAQFTWRSIRAKLLARADRRDEADELSREAVAFVESTDALNQHAKVLADRSEILLLSGRLADAARCAEQARGLFERKGNVVAALRAKNVLDTFAVA